MRFCAQSIRSVLNKECKTLNFKKNEPGPLIRNVSDNVVDTLAFNITSGRIRHVLNIDVMLGVHFIDINSIFAQLCGYPNGFDYISSDILFNIGDALPEWTSSAVPYYIECSEDNLHDVAKDIVNKIQVYGTPFYNHLHDFEYYSQLILNGEGWCPLRAELTAIIYLHQNCLNRAVRYYEALNGDIENSVEYEIKFLENLKRLQTDKEYYAYITSFFKNKF